MNKVTVKSVYLGARVALGRKLEQAFERDEYYEGIDYFLTLFDGMVRGLFLTEHDFAATNMRDIRTHTQYAHECMQAVLFHLDSRQTMGEDVSAAEGWVHVSSRPGASGVMA